MRRTYRSKKDTGGCLDHRDVLLTMDDKKSAFDAFYIQNIKQTKRELSCMGYSNHHTVTNNKVRKRKYVKRLVKEVEPPLRDSIGSSIFLTPDKSIHVKKAPDLFDLLLNSSPANVEQKQGTNTNTFDQLLCDMPTKAYGRKRCTKVKKINYSQSNSSESEKENIETNRETSNTSDIQSYEFVIEKEAKPVPTIDESINNIVKKISLINNLNKPKRSHGSIKKIYKNRLTMNLQSPNPSNSPLCSTPFNYKDRSNSIYKISPIPMKEFDESPNYVTVVEENNVNNDSIIFVPKNLQNNAKGSQNSNSTPVNHFSKYKNTVNSKPMFESTDEDSNQVSNKEKELQRSLEHKHKESKTSLVQADDSNQVLNNQNVKLDNSVQNKHKENEISLVQTSEVEPLYGFSLSSFKVPENDDSILDIDAKNESIILPLSKTTRSKDSSKEEAGASSNVIEIDSINNDLVECNYLTVPSEPFLGFTKVDTINVDSDSQDLSDSSISKTDCSNNEHSDSQSLYDTCSENDSIEDKLVAKKPVVAIERMNLEEFAKYYKIANHQNSVSNRTSEHYTSTYIDENEFSNDDCDENSREDNDSDYNDENSILSEKDVSREANEINEENKSIEEDKCISFVTTRRRNEFANNSSIFLLNDSNDSSYSLYKTDFSNNGQTHDNLNDIESKTDVNTSVHEDKLSKEDNVNKNLEKNRKNSMWTLDNTSRESLAHNSFDPDKQGIILQPGKKWERSLSIYRRMTMANDHFDESVLENENLNKKGRKYRQSVIHTMEMQEKSSLHNDSIHSCRTTFTTKPSRSTIRIVKESNSSRLSLSTTSVSLDDLTGYLEDCDDTVVELSKLSIADSDHEVTVLEKFHELDRVTTARDYVLRRCNQTDTISFDECYPDSLLKNCHKIGEGVYGEVFLWRAPDGRARVMKIVPIAGTIKVNGEQQKDFHEIISEIVIAMELCALRAPLPEIECHLDEGKDICELDLHSVENATDVFNEVLAVRCVYGSYPSRLLDLWELYDETKGSENDNPAILPADQQYIVLELANAGQDLESYQFNSAEQAHALFLQIAFALAVAEEAYQFEHRDLHWGNVLIAPTEQKYATFVIRGRAHRVPRCGVAATVIDYSLSRLSLPLARHSAALYNDLASDESLFSALGDYQFTVYRLMRAKLGNDWKNFEPYTNVLWLHYTVDKMITALRYKRVNTKLHRQYIGKLKGIKDRILNYGSATQFVLTDNEY